MEGLNQENQESRENGKNVHIKTQFLRHGEKSSFYGDLSEKGIEDAKKYGREFPSSEGGVKGFHSHIKRSKDTLENIIQEVESEKKYKSRPRNELLLND
ncbi:MAG: hypothetical protein KJZ60_05965, partial [Ignavibacteriaceae bacterium]|nr:hypothetical protein [Ignavibacteriaceae bacterium]